MRPFHFILSKANSLFGFFRYSFFRFYFVRCGLTICITGRGAEHSRNHKKLARRAAVDAIVRRGFTIALVNTMGDALLSQRDSPTNSVNRYTQVRLQENQLEMSALLDYEHQALLP